MDTDFNNANVPDTRTRLGWRAGYLLASFGVYMVDQSSKAWAVRSLRFGADRTIIRGFIDLVYTARVTSTLELRVDPLVNDFTRLVV